MGFSNGSPHARSRPAREEKERLAKVEDADPFINLDKLKEKARKADTLADTLLILGPAEESMDKAFEDAAKTLEDNNFVDFPVLCSQLKETLALSLMSQYPDFKRAGVEIEKDMDFMQHTVFAKGEGYVPILSKNAPKDRDIGVYEVGDTSRYKIYKQCLVFYEDFSIHLKAFLEYELIQKLKQI